jgi:hypothetical protein
MSTTHKKVALLNQRQILEKGKELATRHMNEWDEGKYTAAEWSKILTSEAMNEGLGTEDAITVAEEAMQYLGINIETIKSMKGASGDNEVPCKHCNGTGIDPDSENEEECTRCGGTGWQYRGGSDLNKASSSKKAFYAVREKDNVEYTKSRGLKHYGPDKSYLVYDTQTERTVATCGTPEEAKQICDEKNGRKTALDELNIQLDNGEFPDHRSPSETEDHNYWFGTKGTEPEQNKFGVADNVEQFAPGAKKKLRDFERMPGRFKNIKHFDRKRRERPVAPRVASQDTHDIVEAGWQKIVDTPEYSHYSNPSFPDLTLEVTKWGFTLFSQDRTPLEHGDLGDLDGFLTGMPSTGKFAALPGRPKKYPDTMAGALEFLKDESTFDLRGAVGKMDSVEGVWLITMPLTHEAAIVYLAGYKDPFGKIREHNDFEKVESKQSKTSAKDRVLRPGEYEQPKELRPKWKQDEEDAYQQEEQERTDEEQSKKAQVKTADYPCPKCWVSGREGHDRWIRGNKPCPNCGETRKTAEIEMHETPKFLPPRDDMRRHIDEDLKKELHEDDDIEKISAPVAPTQHTFKKSPTTPAMIEDIKTPKKPSSYAYDPRMLNRTMPVAEDPHGAPAWVTGSAKVARPEIQAAIEEMIHCPKCKTCVNNAAILRLVQHLKADHGLGDLAQVVSQEVFKMISEAKKQPNLVTGAEEVFPIAEPVEQKKKPVHPDDPKYRREEPETTYEHDPNMINEITHFGSMKTAEFADMWDKATPRGRCKLLGISGKPTTVLFFKPWAELDEREKGLLSNWLRIQRLNPGKAASEKGDYWLDQVAEAEEEARTMFMKDPNMIDLARMDGVDMQTLWQQEREQYMNLIYDPKP